VKRVNRQYGDPFALWSPNQSKSFGVHVTSPHFEQPQHAKPSIHLCHQQQSSTAMAEIKIDKKTFQERLSQFYSAWKADKRSGDAIFGGASSILVLMGKAEEVASFQKNNALHV
jgi:hypothetical protein